MMLADVPPEMVGQVVFSRPVHMVVVKEFLDDVLLGLVGRQHQVVVAMVVAEDELSTSCCGQISDESTRCLGTLVERSGQTEANEARHRSLEGGGAGEARNDGLYGIASHAPCAEREPEGPLYKMHRRLT
jgi:hypothetical protein